MTILHNQWLLDLVQVSSQHKKAAATGTLDSWHISIQIDKGKIAVIALKGPSMPLMFTSE